LYQIGHIWRHLSFKKHFGNQFNVMDEAVMKFTLHFCMLNSIWGVFRTFQSWIFFIILTHVVAVQVVPFRLLPLLYDNIDSASVGSMSSKSVFPTAQV
jgi:hypothetical protein